MVGIFDCGGVLGKYEIRLKERKVVNMEALNTYKTEKTLAEQMNERLAEMKMTKAEAALKMNYSRAALSQYLNGKYASDPTELEKKVREFLAATGGVAEGQEPENSVPTGAGTLKKKVEFFESRDFVQTIGVCQACQEYMGLGIIVGKSGQGKTHALKKYAELPRVAYIECDDTMACRDLVEAIENGIGLPKGYGGTIWSRVNRIREFFNTNEGRSGMFEFVHIVGVSSKALWASLCTIANDFLTKYKRPLFFVCEARGKKADESLEDYVNAMLEERKGINNIYMQVVCSNSRYQRMDGRVQDINNAGIVTGLYGRAKESQSIGEVKSFPISEAKLLKLLPEGIEDYIETLDKAKYVTIRQYIGKEDYYVTSANMMSPEGSDYSYAEDVRVSNRLVKAVRAKALDELQVEVDPGDIETSITNIQEQLNTPVEDAVRDKVISSGSVTIDTENLNILVDEKLDINITYVPMGHVREMNLTFAVENPYAAS